MMRSLARPLLALFAAASLVAGAAIAQDDEAGKSRFVRTLEGMLSAPGRQVSLDGLEGAFSSSPRAERISVADAEGVWLEIEGVAVVWNRTALFRRTLDIDSLRAERVALLRRPAPAETAAEGGGGLPVDIIVDAFTLPEIALAPAVAGFEAHLSAEGAARVSAEAATARLSMLRKDREGRLTADLRLDPQANALTANLQLSEPAGGLLAELMRLRGRPAVALSLAGAGPLSDWRAELAMQADGARVLSGAVAIVRAADGYRLSGDLAAALEAIAPPDYAALFAGDARIVFDATRGDDGAIAVESATIRSEGVEASLSGVLSPDRVPQRAELSLRLGQAGRATLPFVPGEVSVASLSLSAGLDAGAASPWRAEVTASGVESAFGSVGSLSAMASGEARNLAAPEQRATSFRVGASAEAVQPVDPALATALGPTLRVTAGGMWSAGQPVSLESLQLMLTGMTAGFAGAADAGALDGRFTANVTDLSRLAPLAGRPLAGAANLGAEGRVQTDATFELALDGEATDLRLGIAALDPLLAGATNLRGGIARTGDGFRFDDLRLANAAASASVSGSLAAPALDLSVEARVADLASLTPRARGEASVTARLTGTTDAPQVEASASGEAIELMDRPLTGASARFSGVLAGPGTAGKAELSATLDGIPVRGSARLSAGESGARLVEDLALSVGESQASGSLTIGADGLVSGDISVASPDLETVAPLFLVQARGALDADIALRAEGGAQAARFSATATDIVYETITLGAGEIEGAARDVFRQPQIDGTFSLRDLHAGGLTIVSASGTATRQGAATAFSVDARLADGSANLTGSLRPQGAGSAIALSAAAYRRPGVDLRLAQPTTITVENGTARVPATTLTVNGGSLQVAGSAGAALNFTAELSGVPAALADTFAPNLGAEGSISGSASVTGTPAAPAARFTLDWQGASVAASRNAGLGALSAAAEGALAGQELTITSSISGAGGLAVRVAGSVGAAAGAPLDLAVTGAVPLALGNRSLASRGAALSGALDIDIRVGGTAAAPQFSGRVTSEGGGFVDPDTGIVLQGLSLAASVSNNRLVVDRLTARSGGGTVSASGSIGLGGGFPVDMRAEVRQARYVDGTLVAATFSADLTLTGSFADGTTLAGSIAVDRAEITVPESLPRDSIAVDVEHVHTPPDVARTLALARAREGNRAGGGRGGIALDLAIDAPRQIFVRGRGLDAELGGSLRLRGPVSRLVADGAFQMRRGRLDIFTQRITFDRGAITFAGDLDPILDFAGTTRSKDITVTVTVSGEASDPQVTFSSVPELPQDEVLAHLIFNKGIGDLSPVQIARLASAAASLSGGSGSGLLDRLRESTGLDDLDIVTDDEGEPALAAGRYLSENVYIGVQQGATADSSRVSIDLDITEDVKARAAVSPSGDSSIGVFFEREY